MPPRENYSAAWLYTFDDGSAVKIGDVKLIADEDLEEGPPLADLLTISDSGFSLWISMSHREWRLVRKINHSFLNRERRRIRRERRHKEKARREALKRGNA